MNEFEIRILDFLQSIFKSDFLDAVMPFITSLSDSGAIWIVISIILICLKKTRKAGLGMAVALVIGLLVGNVFLKNVVGRVRPYDINTSVTLLVNKLSDFSFPSGHTLAAFEAATALLIKHKKWGIAALILAVLTAFSRLYLYVHYPSDVLFSIVLGIGIAYLATLIVDKLYNGIG